METPTVDLGQLQALDSGERKEREAPRRIALPEVTKTSKTLSTEDQARLKVIMEFASSMPLVDPDYDMKWLLGLIENQLQAQESPALYQQVLNGQFQLQYQPAWKNHPVYKDLTAMLQKQPVLQKLDTFIKDSEHCAGDAVSLVQSIYRVSAGDLPSDLVDRGGWNFITSIYVDSICWYAGKSLHDPSERDYVSENPGTSDQSAKGPLAMRRIINSLLRTFHPCP